MRFSLQFIQEFCTPQVSPDDLASLLTFAGMEVERIEQIDDDWTFDIEITANRYDWFSTVGIAREVACVCSQPLNIKFPHAEDEPSFSEVDIVIEDINDCSLYVARLLRNVCVKDSPQWLKERLTHCGLSVINNVVDAANYCMLKWGNPLHAFDFDKIEGAVCIRRAKDGEAFLGLDGKERRLTAENLVIADEQKVIALAGVMGAQNTEVGEKTKNVLLEAAFFTPLTIRRSRRSAGLETDSSYRFERRVFPDYVEVASCEARNLIVSCAGAKACGYKAAGEKPPAGSKEIILNLSEFKDYIGEEIPHTSIKDALTRLDFGVQEISPDTLRVNVPPFRLDIEREVDLYEEIVRIFGYDNIQPQLPSIQRAPQKGMYEFKNSLRNFLISIGLKEIISFSITADALLNALQEKDFLRLSNPLRAQENAMRTTLLTGALEVVRHNLNQKECELRLFELANVYKKKKGGFVETPALSLIVSSQTTQAGYLKAIVEELMAFLNLDHYQWRELKTPHFTHALELIHEKTPLGFIGKLDTKEREACQLKEELFFSQCNVECMFQKKREKIYIPFSRHPYVSRDISIALRRNKKFKEIEEVIIHKGHPYLRNIEMIEVYKGKKLSPPHLYGLTIRLNYQAEDKTLASEEVEKTHRTIREALAKMDGVSLR